MTCEDCQAIIIDMARGGEIDRATRDDARRHAALCPRCGELQQEQQWLTTQLRAVAAEASTQHAPPRVEIAVLAAWRASQNAAAVTTGGAAATAAATAERLAAAPANAFAPAKAWKPWMISGVALAGLAAAAMAMLIVWPATRGASQATTPGALTRASANIADSDGTRAALDSNKQGRGDGAQPPAAETAQAQSSAASPAAARQEDEDAVDGAAMTAPPAGMRPTRARVEAVMASAARQDTEFLPLPYVEPLRSTEARHVIRVSMTSGDEMILGMLPADRRSGQPFEADVLVGEDGIARAIRIVH